MVLWLAEPRAVPLVNPLQPAGLLEIQLALSVGDTVGTVTMPSSRTDESANDAIGRISRSVVGARVCALVSLTVGDAGEVVGALVSVIEEVTVGKDNGPVGLIAMIFLWSLVPLGERTKDKVGGL